MVGRVCNDHIDPDEHAGTQPYSDAVEQFDARIQEVPGNIGWRPVRQYVADGGCRRRAGHADSVFPFVFCLCEVGRRRLPCLPGYPPVSKIRSDAESGPVFRGGHSGQALYWQGFLTSATNPKAIIFFAALFPQFLIPTQPMAMQFVMLSATYLFLDGCFLLFYGGFARVISGFFRNRSTSCLNRTSGTLLIIAAIILGLEDMSPDTG